MTPSSLSHDDVIIIYGAEFKFSKLCGGRQSARRGGGSTGRALARWCARCGRVLQGRVHVAAEGLLQPQRHMGIVKSEWGA
jgi:hypothetical protein